MAATKNFIMVDVVHEVIFIYNIKFLSHEIFTTQIITVMLYNV